MKIVDSVSLSASSLMLRHSECDKKTFCYAEL
uniref:Uncharacterized protein n=1 Tax=Anguilla anguilla TaxID=7936 RepID=A0A0E9XX90_ANGAN